MSRRRSSLLESLKKRRNSKQVAYNVRTVLGCQYDPPFSDYAEKMKDDPPRRRNSLQKLRDALRGRRRGEYEPKKAERSFPTDYRDVEQQAEAGINRPFNVLQLARKFSAQQAHQEQHRYKMERISEIQDTAVLSTLLDDCDDFDQRKAIRARMQEVLREQKDGQRKSPSKPVGGIESLSSGNRLHVSSNMSKTAGEKFKTMDAQNSGSSGPQMEKPVIRSPSSIKDRLLRWCQAKTRDYPHVNIQNFSSSWADGMAFCALIHNFCPDAFDFYALDPKNRAKNFELAFRIAQEKGDIYPLLEVEDMIEMGDRPEWKSVFTYVSTFYKRFQE